MINVKETFSKLFPTANILLVYQVINVNRTPTNQHSHTFEHFFNFINGKVQVVLKNKGLPVEACVNDRMFF
jgi:hypothetical protein